MKRINTIYAILLSLVLILSATGCKKKRISYTEMVKRETKEVQAFMDKNNFRVIKSLPADLKMASNEFVQVEEGVWINVIEPGKLDDMAKTGETPVLVRFSYKSIGNRMIGAMSTFSNIGSADSTIPPVSFIFQNNLNSEYQQGAIPPAPNSTTGEEGMSSFACNAMMIALKYVPLGSTIQMITSFREGPSFTFQSSNSFANDNDAGVALYYDKLRFVRKP